MYAKLRPLPLALAVAERALFNFSNQWLAGLQPQLILETSPDGQICVSSRVVAGDVPTHAKLVLRRQAEEAEDRVNPHYQAGEAGHRRRPHRHGPSRQRRRLRREAARAAAAAGTADQAAEKTEPAVKPGDKNDWMTATLLWVEIQIQTNKNHNKTSKTNLLMKLRYDTLV